MAYEQRDNSGSLFKNDRREKDSHPTHTGSITIEGKEYWLSAWTKEANGKRFFSLAVKPKEARGQARQQDDHSHSGYGHERDRQGGENYGRYAGQPLGAGPDLNDDIPFAPEFR